MIIDKNMGKRLGVFFFYDGSGIADDYVIYLLQEYSKVHDKLIIVSNGEVDENTRDMFLSITPHVIIRENEGLDVMAYSTAFKSVGWKELEGYDEVSIANFTLMGPVFPLIKMYENMADKDVDFWGISKHFKFDHDFFGNLPYGYMPEHIQSHYMVFRSSLVKSKEFQEFWDNLPPIRNYKDSVALFETTFTKKFEDYGFKWCVCADVDDYEGISYNPIMEYPIELIKRGCPLFKRRSFFQEADVVLDTTMGEATYDLFDYVDKETEYDTGLIWKNLIRTCHPSDYIKTLHLEYILPTNKHETVHTSEIALLVHLINEKTFEESIEYLNSIENIRQCVLITDSEHRELFEIGIKEYLEVSPIVIDEQAGWQEKDCFLNAVAVIDNVDYFCYYHDDVLENVVADSFHKKNSRAMLYNKDYVNCLINLFNDNAYLGMLVPMEPNHAGYYSTLGRQWHGYYDDVIELLKKLNIKAPIAPDKEPIFPMGMIAWFRYDAFETIRHNCNDIDVEDSVFKRALPYICTGNGFYPAYVTSDYDARIELTNLRYYISENNKLFDRIRIEPGTQKEMIRELESRKHLLGRKISDRFVEMAMKTQKIMPSNVYDNLIKVKRKIFGPYDL